MRDAIISDTSCLILLHNIGRLELLKKIFGVVIVTDIIANEFGLELPAFIEIKNPLEENFQKVLNKNIDAGEASAIALGLENDHTLLIVDDLSARKVAEEFGLEVTGTIGVLIEAKRSGQIESLKIVLEEIQKTNFRLSPTVAQQALMLVGE